MTLWLILTIMTSAAAVWMSVPLIRRFERPRAGSAGDIAVYRDQLHEVDSERQLGLIDDTQAEAARIEIKRRVLTAERSERPMMPKLSSGERNFALICATGIVVLGSVGLYAVTGRPDLPAVQAAARRGLIVFSADRSAADGSAGAAQALTSEDTAELRPQTGLPSVEEMIERLAARLQQNPKDTEGWRTLGWSYLSIGQFREAAEAYSKAIALYPDIAEFRGARIEALVGLANGVVTSDARNAIEETLKVDPKNARARFFVGLAKEQDGDETSAVADWTTLLKDVNVDEPWVTDLQNRINALKDGGSGATLAARPKSAVAAGLPGISTSLEGSAAPQAVDKGPSPEDVQAAETMAPTDRSAMIRAMVEGLAARLVQSPFDADGWIKLIRSRMVLGESDLAKRALAQSLDLFENNTPERDRIAAVAQQLGLEPNNK
jgi:cytochrome c-type biogenesis protein CcmH